MGIACQTNPVTVDENLGLLAIVQVTISELIEVFDTPILKHVDDVGGVTSDRHECHKGQVLHKTTSLTFRSFGWTDHSPMRVMKLSRLGELSLLRERCGDTTHMGKR